VKKFSALALALVSLLWLTGATWLPLFAAASGGGAATLTYEAFATENGGTAIATYTSVAFGTASSNRVLAFVTGARINAADANTVASATIGGVSATQASGAVATNATNQMSTDIWYASVPTGTSGTIVVNWNAANARTGLYLYAVTTTNPTPSSGNGVASASSVASLNASITVPANGVGIVGFLAQQTGNTLSFTNATQDASNALAGAANGMEAGHTTSTGAISITGTQTGTNNNAAMSMAAWGP
jgi:hypothetical protein